MEARESQTPSTFNIHSVLANWEYCRTEKAIPETLEPHIPEQLLDIDRHKNCSEAGLEEYIEKISVYADPEGDSSQQRQASILHDLHTTLGIEDAGEKAESLVLILAQSRRANFFSIEDKEREALEDPEVAVAFITEVLTQNPTYRPVEPENITSFTEFDDSEERDHQEKVCLAAKVTHLRYTSLTPAGVYNWYNEVRVFDKSPRDIIDTGSNQEVDNLLAWCDGARVQSAT